MASSSNALSQESIDQGLIYDIGVNSGEDTRFYLDKGFRVIGIEANPLLVEELKKTFSSEIEKGLLTLVESGVWNERKQLKFYRNLDNSHWSSFDEVYGCRNGSNFTELQIACVTIDDLLREHGTPRFMKIDVEGADKLIVKDLANQSTIPNFISVEEYGIEALNDLKAAGYSKFKFTAQRDKSWATPPNPSTEGQYVDKTFDGYDSGLFGLELPGEWLDFENAFSTFTTHIRNEKWEYIGPEHEWYDIHAMV